MLKTPLLVLIVHFLTFTYLSPAVNAQTTKPHCFFVCQPELSFETGISFGPIFSRPLIAQVNGDSVVTKQNVSTEANFEATLAIGIPTELPRIGFTVETIFVPSASSFTNPFTEQTATELGLTSLTGNEIEFELELNIDIITEEQTSGWLGSHFDIVDKLSQAERPGETAHYTHKLNFELDTALRIFHWLPDGNWLRNIELEGSLDYVATGLPKKGDTLKDEFFLTDDSPWSFTLLFIFPIAPLFP